VAEAVVRPLDTVDDDAEGTGEEEGGGDNADVFELLTGGESCFVRGRPDALAWAEFPSLTAKQLTIKTSFTIEAGTFGYLFSKGSASTIRRDFAVYLRQSDS